MIKYSLFIFIFHIYAKFHTQKKKKQNKTKQNLIMTCVFECFQSPCHILKELHEFLHMMGAIIIFGENVFIFNFVIIDW
jgi:uncharacterized protein (DUF486 family)